MVRTRIKSQEKRKVVWMDEGGERFEEMLTYKEALTLSERLELSGCGEIIDAEWWL